MTTQDKVFLAVEKLLALQEEQVLLQHKMMVLKEELNDYYRQDYENRNGSLAETNYIKIGSCHWLLTFDCESQTFKSLRVSQANHF
jgi:hypothetical protein